MAKEREAKFHIYDIGSCPLCWEDVCRDEDRAIEFDTITQAIEFLVIIQKYFPAIAEKIYSIKKDVLYNETGYMHGVLALELVKNEIRQRGINL